MLESHMTPRIGFAGKWLNSSSESKDKKIHAEERELNTGGTTVAWLNRQTRTVAEDKLWGVISHNLKSIKNVLNRVKDLDPRMHMMRIGSDILPMYTEATWRYFTQQPDVKRYCETEFAAIGDFARKHNIRLSFHPGQFCVLASNSPDIVTRSIEEFEYHADMARMMGYGASWHDHGFKINVHISGRQGPEGIRKAYQRLSPEARNTITIENEEMSHGLLDCLSISDLVPIVLDIHHHWVREGEYLDANDDRVKRVMDSWRGVRPTLHYSISREDVLDSTNTLVKPEHSILLESGHKRAKLRAHSDFYWNDAVNEWALSYWPNFDIQCESKAKNLASFRLFEQAIK